MSAGSLIKSANVRPPATGNNNEVDLTAATSPAEIATGLSTFPNVWITIVVSVAHNLTFGAAGLAAPADSGVFPAGYVHMYELRPDVGTNAVFRVMPNANGKMKWWISSRP